MKIRRSVPVVLIVLAILTFILLWSKDSSPKNGTYFYSDDTYIVIEGNTITRFSESESVFSAEYTFKNGQITYQYEDDKAVYNYKNGVIFSANPLEKGVIPDGEKFDATVGNEDGSYTITFGSDGIAKKRISLLGIRTVSFTGYYERRGNIITIYWEEGDANTVYTENGAFYDAAYILGD